MLTGKITSFFEYQISRTFRAIGNFLMREIQRIYWKVKETDEEKTSDNV